MTSTSIRVAVGLATVIALAGACGAPPTKTAPAVTTTALTAPATGASIPVVDQGATPPGWVPVTFGDLQVSVPASWVVTFGCPSAEGTVYLGGAPTMFCPNESPGTPIVVLGTASSASFSFGSPGVINHIPVEWLDPDHTVVQIPSLDASISATGPLANRVVETMTSSPRVVALAGGGAPAVPGDWHEVTFGGVRASVPKSWAISRGAGWPEDPEDCVPIDLSLPAAGVVLDAGTTEFPVACPADPRIRVVAPHDGLVIDPGPDGPLSTDGSLGPCRDIHGLRVCPTSDGEGVLVLAVELGDRSRPVAVEVGLAGSGLIARTIVDSLRPA